MKGKAILRLLEFSMKKKKRTQIIARTSCEAACAAVLSSLYPLLCIRQPDENAAKLSTQVHPGLHSMDWREKHGVCRSYGTKSSLLHVMQRWVHPFLQACRTCPVLRSRHSLAQCCTGLSYERTSELQQYSNPDLMFWQEDSRFCGFY